MLLLVLPADGVQYSQGVKVIYANQNNDAWIVKLNNPVHRVLAKHLLAVVAVQLLKQQRSQKHQNKKKKMLLKNL
jgi:hypothetical protein